jgi:hypothetical protein
VPSFVWLQDGTAILDDLRLPESQQAFERLDPVTGKRRPVLDMKQAVASLKSIEPDAGVRDALPWPIAFTTTGKQALYLFAGDIFLLDLDSSTFSRVTRTPEEEKDPEFSPNGRFIPSCAPTISTCGIWPPGRKRSSRTTVPKPP